MFGVMKMPIYSQEEIANRVKAVGEDMGISPKGIQIAYATIFVECGWLMYANAKDPATLSFPHDRVGSDGRSSGLYQQQPPWWGGEGYEGARKRMDIEASSEMFFTALDHFPYDTDEKTPGGWAQTVQRSAFPLRYDEHWNEAQELYAEISGDEILMPATGFTGDPIWLEDVLREALGDRLIVEEGWNECGVGGTMGRLWGVMIHHTGNSRERVEVIRDGRPDLQGPLSQCLIKPDGICHLVAIGPCHHAGNGSYPGIANANEQLIGFECAWPRIGAGGSYDSNEKWPDEQIKTMRDATAAVLKKLGYKGDHVIGHKEWAGAAQGKWDPGNLDMRWFRSEVQKDLDGYEFPGEKPSKPMPAPILPPDYDKEIWDQLRYTWPQLGYQTLVNAVGEMRDKILGVTDYADWKAGKAKPPKLKGDQNA